LPATPGLPNASASKYNQVIVQAGVPETCKTFHVLVQALSAAPGHAGTLASLGSMWLKHAKYPAHALPYLEHLASIQSHGTAASSEAHELLGDCLL